MILKKFKESLFIKQSYKKNFQKIIIASTGRSGSTFLWNNLSYFFIKEYSRFSFNIESTNLKRVAYGSNKVKKIELNLNFFQKRLVRTVKGWDSDINNSNIFKKKIIIKTHDIFNIDNPEIKYIFIFRDPLAILTSMLYKIDNNESSFISNHLKHLRSKYTINQILEKDILNYKSMSKSFIENKTKHNILFINFNSLKKSEEVLNEYLGFEISLPELNDKEYHPLISKLDSRLKHSLIETYDELRNCLVYEDNQVLK